MIIISSHTLKNVLLAQFQKIVATIYDQLLSNKRCILLSKSSNYFLALANSAGLTNQYYLL